MAGIIEVLNYSGDKNIAPYSIEYAEGHQQEVLDNKYGNGTFDNIWSGIFGDQGAVSGISNLFNSIFGGVAAMKYAQNTNTQNVNTTFNDSGRIGMYVAIGGVALVALVIVIVLVTGRRNK